MFIIILIKEYQKFRLYTFLLGVIFIIILGNSYKAQFERMFKAPFKEMGIIEDIKYEAEGLIIFTPTHDSHIRTAFKMFKDKPILGHGPKMFRIKCSDKKYSTGIKSCNTHPHNFYVQLLAETGILGFSFLFAAFPMLFFCFIKQLKSIYYKEKKKIFK